MARPISRPVEPEISVPIPKMEDKRLAASNFLAGMISTADAADIPDNALSYAKNARFSYGKVTKRDGTAQYTPTKPDSKKIRLLYEHVRRPNSRIVLRATASGLHYSGASWTAISGTLNGATNGHIEIVNILGTLVLANGEDKLQKIDLETGTISDLCETAPKARYLTGFFNRAVAASVGVSYPGTVSVYWSGDSNLDTFDAAVDESAGQAPIEESPADVSDFITGIFGFSNVLVLTRERSIWLATKIPTASNPFNFYNARVGQGCDVPSSIQPFMGGIAFLDQDTRGVWHYVPGQAPQRMGYNVEQDIISAIDDPDLIFSGVAGERHLYLLGIPQSDGTAKIWIYNAQEKNWAFDEVADAVAALSRIKLTNFSSYDDLESTYATYDDIDVTYDELTDTPQKSLVLMLGKSDGDIIELDDTEYEDVGDEFDMELRSKEFSDGSKEALMTSTLAFTYKCL